MPESAGEGIMRACVCAAWIVIALSGCNLAQAGQDSHPDRDREPARAWTDFKAGKTAEGPPGAGPEALPALIRVAEPSPAGPPAAPNTGAPAAIYEQLDLFVTALDKIRTEYADPVDDRELIKNAIRGMARAAMGLNDGPETKGAIRELRHPEPKAGTMDELLDALGSYVEQLRRTQKGWGSGSGEKLITAAIAGMLEGLDRQSSYIAPQGNNRCRSGSVGVEVKEEDEPLRVVSVIEASPAMQAGIRGGDVITHVDGVALSGLPVRDAVARLCGPAGSAVRVTVVREGQSQPIEITIVRQLVRIVPVPYGIEGNIGRIKIKTFQSAHIYEYLKQAIEDLQRAIGSKLKGYVIDLRGNSGGLLDQAIKVADAFLDKGMIVVIRRRDGSKSYTANPGDLTGGKPIVVLIDGGTASGAEIVASALQDQRRAVIVGVPSLGVASIQTQISIGGGHAIRLTTGRMLRTAGVSWEGKGIQPDIVVHAPPGDGNGAQSDPQLQAAMDAIRRHR
jgi:carboxyl-terminal processing protease